jgi:hypothetical protein
MSDEVEDVCIVWNSFSCHDVLQPFPLDTLPLATECDTPSPAAKSPASEQPPMSAADEADDNPPPVPVGVKLGSTRTVVVEPQESVLKTHEALTCLACYEDVLTGTDQVIYGEQAAREYPERVEFMLRSGLPEDDERTETATTFFTYFLQANDDPADSVVVYAIPAIDNERGLANLTSVIEASPIGERLIRSYPESLCGAIPAVGTGLDAIERRFIAVNLGSTTLSACAYRRGEQLTHLATGAVTGNAVDRWIAANVEEETQGRVTIDQTTAREYKEAYADFEDFEPFTDIIQQPGGRHTRVYHRTQRNGRARPICRRGG